MWSKLFLCKENNFECLTIKVSETPSTQNSSSLWISFHQVTFLSQFSLISWNFSYQMVFGIMSSQQQHEMVICASSDVHCFHSLLSICFLSKLLFFVGSYKSTLKCCSMYLPFCMFSFSLLFYFHNMEDSQKRDLGISK